MFLFYYRGYRAARQEESWGENVYKRGVHVGRGEIMVVVLRVRFLASFVVAGVA